jgi:hypothetical protein
MAGAQVPDLPETPGRPGVDHPGSSAGMLATVPAVALPESTSSPAVPGGSPGDPEGQRPQAGMDGEEKLHL